MNTILWCVPHHAEKPIDQDICGFVWAGAPVEEPCRAIEVHLVPNNLSDILLLALEAGIVRRRWSCGSDKVDCTPENTDQMGYLHYWCHWYWDIWTVEQDKIEALYQKAINP